MSDQWQLYYWPKFVGRAEFVRLMFEEAGVKYEEKSENIMELFFERKLKGYPSFAVPMIKKGDFQLGSTPAICQYLGKQFGMYPDSEEDQWHAQAVNETIHDYIAEGCLAYHGKDHHGTYASQEEETKPYIEQFIKERIPKFLTFFETALKANNGGNGFFFGSKITYVDLGAFQILRATEFQFPEAWKNIDSIPLLKALKVRMEDRPNLKAYFQSDRCQAFCGESMM